MNGIDDGWGEHKTMFKLEVFQNPFLPAGSARVDAILTANTTAAVESGNTESLEGLILDVSGSMSGQCLEMMKFAARKAIQMLDESTYFFVIAFTDSARTVYPLSPATLHNRTQAERAIQSLEANGGTHMSEGLAAARRECAKRPGVRGHVLFLTDGKNYPEDVPALMAELLRCQNVFQADCRGVGTDWEPVQLREIADQLLGTAQIIPEPAQLEKDFREAMEKALGKRVGNVRLRLSAPKSGKAKLVFVKQTSPSILDLTRRAVAVDSSTWDFPTGAWAPNESRDFHVAFDVAPGGVGDEMMVCRTAILFGVPEVAEKGGPVLAAWTDPADERSSIINPQVAHYTNQVQLAADIREGLAARARGDVDAATVFLSRAVKMAEKSGNTQVTNKLREVVVHNDDGTINLRANVQKAKVMDLDLSSIVTARAPKK